MFTTIEEGIEIYKAKVREYVQWTKTPEAAHDWQDEMGGGYGLHHASNRGARIKEWEGSLKAMAAALGMTPEEELSLKAECGLTHP